MRERAGTRVAAPHGRTLLFVGDLVDRGPRSPDVLRFAMGAVASGCGLAVQGNHDNKAWRHLDGRKVRVAHGLQATIDQLAAEPLAFRSLVGTFLKTLPYHLWHAGGDLAVAHAGSREGMPGKESKSIKSFERYGETNGEMDSNSF